MKTKLYSNLKCSYCGSDRIDCEDIYDIESVEVEGKEGLADLCLGVCRNCGKHLQWERVFKFVGFRDIESIE